jgi:hypothetical protein
MFSNNLRREGDDGHRSPVPLRGSQAAGLGRWMHDHAERREPEDPQETGQASPAPSWRVRERPGHSSRLRPVG